MIGALIFLQKLRISPDTAFSVNDWTAFVIFITVIGGIGRIEGPIIGTVIFFILRQTLADLGSLYLLMMGAVAIVVMLWAPKGLWGLIAERFGWQALPLQRRLVLTKRNGRKTHEHDHRHLLPHLSGPLLPGNEQGRAEPQQYRAAAARHQEAVRSRRALQGNGRIRRLPADHLAAQSGDRGHRQARRRAAACAHRQRLDGRAVPQISRAFSELCGRALPDRRRGLDQGSAARDQGPRRARRAGLHQCRRRTARSAEIRADFQDHGGVRSADLAASGRHRGDDGLSGREEVALSRCGGASTGPTKHRSPWCAWCSVDCSTAIRN